MWSFPPVPRPPSGEPTPAGSIEIGPFFPSCSGLRKMKKIPPKMPNPTDQISGGSGLLGGSFAVSPSLLVKCSRYKSYRSPNHYLFYIRPPASQPVSTEPKRREGQRHRKPREEIVALSESPGSTRRLDCSYGADPGIMRLPRSGNQAGPYAWAVAQCPSLKQRAQYANLRRMLLAENDRHGGGGRRNEI